MSNGFERRKEQSKEDIRKAAWELFNQFGVAKVSIVDIARKASVAQATIYNNFGSKENLAREFVMIAVDRLYNRAREILTSDKIYSKKLEAFLQYMAEVTAQEKPLETGGTALPTSVNLLNDPEIRKIRDSAEEKLANLLLRLVQEGKEQGQVNLDLSEEALRIYFKLFMDIFTGTQLQYQFHSDPKLVQDLASLMIYGLSGQRN